jgi:hypothetical protein
MNLLLIVIIVLAALVLVAALFVVGIYNKLVALRNRFKNAYAQIDVQLKRRYDLQYHTLKPLVRDCIVVFSALAHVSSGNADEVEKAFRMGAPHLGAKADGLQLLPRAESGLEQLDTALDRLALAVPQIKKRVLEAFVHVVGADGLIQEREAELLRAIADTLDCPIPPFVQIAES